jgi:hypothetical protein
MVATTAFVAVSITLTLAPKMFATYSFRPSGRSAMPSGDAPTAIGAPAAPVATSMGVTEFDPRLEM